MMRAGSTALKGKAGAVMLILKNGWRELKKRRRDWVEIKRRDGESKYRRLAGQRRFRWGKKGAHGPFELRPSSCLGVIGFWQFLDSSDGD
jgi:hypothetical protein